MAQFIGRREKDYLGLPADAEPILNTMPNFVHPDDVECAQQMFRVSGVMRTSQSASRQERS